MNLEDNSEISPPNSRRFLRCSADEGGGSGSVTAKSFSVGPSGGAVRAAGRYAESRFTGVWLSAYGVRLVSRNTCRITFSATVWVADDFESC